MIGYPIWKVFRHPIQYFAKWSGCSVCWLQPHINQGRRKGNCWVKSLTGPWYERLNVANWRCVVSFDPKPWSYQTKYIPASLILSQYANPKPHSRIAGGAILQYTLGPKNLSSCIQSWEHYYGPSIRDIGIFACFFDPSFPHVLDSSIQWAWFHG